MDEPPCRFGTRSVVDHAAVTVSQQPNPGRAVFILAAQPRTGTNYLWELIRRHPECAPGRSPVWEDYVLIHAHHLVRFAEEAQGSWDPVWGRTDHLQGELLRHLGDGIISFLRRDPRRRLVTKSPTVANLDLFFDLFPDAHLLLLVRDGRDVVESGMRTFGWTLESGARSWARGVDRVVQFAEANHHRRLQIVRFEDLVEATEDRLRSLLTWLDLNPRRYPFEQLEQVPVRGSAHYRGDQSDVNWNPLPRPPGFSPVRRWSTWSGQDLSQFDGIAASQLAKLGYETAAMSA